MGESLVRTAGRPQKITGKEFAREYSSFQSGKYGDISKQQFAELLGMPRSTFASYEKNLKDSRGISKLFVLCTGKMCRILSKTVGAMRRGSKRL